MRHGASHGAVCRAAEIDRFAMARRYGQCMHAVLGEYVKEQGVGWKSNPVFIDAFGARHVPDAVTAEGVLLELKPNTPSGRAAGKRQKARYEAVTGLDVRILYYDPPRDYGEGTMGWTAMRRVLFELLHTC